MNLSISHEKLKLLSKLRIPAGWFFFILVVAVGKINHLFPMIIIVIGEIIRTIAAGTIKKNEILTNTGIYKIVRHPLYLGSFLISLGFCLMCNHLLLWIYFLFFFPVCYIPTIILEEQFLENKFGDTFKTYKKSVHAFLPIRIHPVVFKNSFSWSVVVKNDEHYNWLLLTVLLIILQFKSILIYP
ncbi:MAG: isoprenylcysteine carboxylmethyltransferase family protein [Candidatus Omnitrophica bacterium]|nr:isoprenylcysteine carboxylmethyltransferase family protein [Candidatus Omnitrophota bacterium]